jgi:hypothetical protein
MFLPAGKEFENMMKKDCKKIVNKIPRARSILGLELGCLRLCWERHQSSYPNLEGLRFDMHVCMWLMLTCGSMFIIQISVSGERETF